MNLKRHLARLAEARAGNAESTPPVSAASALEELRRKMNEILERREDAAAPSRFEPTALDEVPPRWDFAALADLVTEVSGDFGSYYVRHQQLPVTARVGFQELAAPQLLKADLLALLALDPALQNVNFQRALFLDLETTGLGTGAGVLPFLTGLGWFEGERFQIRQFLLATPDQEEAMLRAVADLVRNAEVLVTFNGKSFDWPLLESRFIMNHLAVPKAPPHLDLLHVARRIHKQRLGRCNLKAIEARVLGFERVDDIDGAEVASRYALYLRTGVCDTLRPVIEHNWLDVVAMAALVSLYGNAHLPAALHDPVGVVRTLKRAKAYTLAVEICGRALANGASSELYRARAEIHRALGDRPSAIADLERADDCPHARLQLAKLYEHFLKRPELALATARRGTTETPHLAERRQARLSAKLAAPEASGAPARGRRAAIRPTGPKPAP